MRSAGLPSSKRMSPGCAMTSLPWRASQRRSSRGRPVRGPMRSRASAISSTGVGQAGGAAVAGEGIRVPPGCNFRIPDFTRLHLRCGSRRGRVALACSSSISQMQDMGHPAAKGGVPVPELPRSPKTRDLWHPAYGSSPKKGEGSVAPGLRVGKVPRDYQSISRIRFRMTAL